jgi:putative spermidine/putrescine transport system ATP-binding protein
MMDSDARISMVRLESVSKTYSGNYALMPITLEIRKGEFLALLGPSGSGKTTLLNIIAGMISPTSGRLYIEGSDVTNLPPEKRGLGMVFQNYALMPHMSVYKNVAFPLEIRGVSRKEIHRRVMQALELVHLSHMADKKPKELSGGQQQRISLARCMVYDPSLILMDEPLGALDKNLREQMQLEIKRLHSESGITMVYVTHDQEEAFNMADRIMLMNGGAVEQIAPPVEMYQKPISRFAAAFLGQSSLLAGEVVSPNVMRLSCGYTVAIMDSDARGEGYLLLRPESLKISPASQGECHNVLQGVLRDTLINGGVVKHFVDLPGGDYITVQELANMERSGFSRGSAVTVGWSTDVGRFLQH